MAADGCVEGTTIVASASDQTTDLDTFLAWSEAPIGAVVEVQCVCGIPLPRTATRLCAGGFAAGGQWDQPMHQECNFTDIVRELCLMPEVCIYLHIHCSSSSACTYAVPVSSPCRMMW